MAHIKDSQSYHFSAQAPQRDFSMLFAVVVAVVVHAVIIWGITFSDNISPADKVQEVATVLTQNMQENEEANFIANASQEGGGQVRQQLRLETTQISPMSDDAMNDTQDIINLQKQQRQQRYQDSYLRTTLSYREVEQQSDNKEEDTHDDLREQEERLRQEIATLEAQLSQKQQVFAKKTKIETVDSNATTHGKAAQYLERFRQHVENVATQHYPAQAQLQNIHGDVRLMVIISSDGTVKAIRLLESSGSTILDEAAKKSVRQSAPFGKFTDDMSDIVELRIIRTWRYSDSIQVTY
ncbi:energy transducer TonB [Psychrobacter sp. I-STPA6b]|uniref:energy transducer TonB n=1 Tax=Psychrobacter sp. I-STPA6b TaxID=2585718 RepID=UPI001D0C8B80|nr:energy transducer TonB [Psychrobacter sp. I-STPA6b]